jgi:hypothetical protein
MKRRDMLKRGIAGLLALSLFTESKAKANNTQEERTRKYLDNLPIWNERMSFSEDGYTREYLFTNGYDRDEWLDLCEEDGYALVYSPRGLIQRGHFYDILWVKIGKKNITGISELYRKSKSGPFKKIPDCMNRKEGE